jgi:hypothetical protein
VRIADEALADRALARPHPLRQALVDDCDGRGLGDIRVGEKPSLEQARADGFEVARQHGARVRGPRVVAVGVALAQIRRRPVRQPLVTTPRMSSAALTSSTTLNASWHTTNAARR